MRAHGSARRTARQRRSRPVLRQGTHLAVLNKKERPCMQTLSYQTLAQTGYRGYLLPSAPEKVLQFGE